MKSILLVLLSILTISVIAQKRNFVRVFDLKGKKISSGQIMMITDTSVQIRENSSVMQDFLVSTIGKIKTKRSGGHDILVGGLIGAATLGILGAIAFKADPVPDPNPWAFDIGPSSSGEGAAAGIMLGIPLGVVVGTITFLAKNSRTFNIQGDPVKWKEFTSAIKIAMH